MSAKIYCIEDINDLKYVGSTTQSLTRRFTSHQCKSNYCSSKKLNLHNAIIYELETCEKENRKERERYWINKIDCVNKYKLNGRDKESLKITRKRYQQNNREKINEYKRKWRKNLRPKHKDNISIYNK